MWGCVDVGKAPLRHLKVWLSGKQEMAEAEEEGHGFKSLQRMCAMIEVISTFRDTGQRGP